MDIDTLHANEPELEANDVDEDEYEDAIVADDIHVAKRTKAIYMNNIKKYV